MSESRFVLDASALLCLLFQDEGAARVEACLGTAVISAVNYGEVIAKLADRGVPLATLERDLADFELPVVAIDRALAEAAGRIGPGPARTGLAIGDRFCLALAQRLGATALTCDRGWIALAERTGIVVEVVGPSLATHDRVRQRANSLLDDPNPHREPAAKRPSRRDRPRT